MAKQAAVALAVAGFLAVLLLARASHAGTSSVSSTSSSTPSTSSSSHPVVRRVRLRLPVGCPVDGDPQAQTSVS